MLALLAFIQFASLGYAQAPASGVGGDKAFAVVASERPFEATPLLRVDTAGHAGRILALAFAADGSRIYSAGEDKVVAVWNIENSKAILRDQSFVTRADTLRWEIRRGPRGIIDVLATHPANGTLAVGGYAARTSNGDITRIAADGSFLPVWAAKFGKVNGAFVAESPGHQDRLAAMAYASDGSALASLDHSGRAFVWSDTAAPRELSKDRAARRKLAVKAVAMLGKSIVLLPEYTGDVGGQPNYRINAYQAASGAPTGAYPLDLAGGVTALAASADGQYLAVSSAAGVVSLIETKSGAATLLSSDRPALSLSFTPSGEYLVCGTQALGELGSRLRVFEVATRKLRRQAKLTHPVAACACSDKYVAYVGGAGSDLVVEALDWPGVDAAGDPAPRKLSVAAGEPVISSLGFVAGGKDYNVVFDRKRGAETERWRVRPEIPSVDRLATPVELTPSPRDYTVVAREGGNRVRWFSGGSLLGEAALDANQQGTYQCHGWITDAAGRVVAIAIGTDFQNGIFVYGCTPATSARLLRYFRGHNAGLTALAGSPDGKFLASAARDGTVRYWSLADLFDETSLSARWGAEVEVRGNQVVLSAVDDLGPLYQQGARKGDAITSVAWAANVAAATPAKIIEHMRAAAKDPTRAGIIFSLRRGENAADVPVTPAWQQVLAVYCREGEWIAGAPSGYYASSAGGEREMGWHVNYNELGRKPDYYSAAQFHDRFYRPDVLRRLLTAGSLERALAAATTALPPIERERAITGTIAERRPPVVTIVSHKVDPKIGQLEITATATPQTNDQVTQLALVIDGVPVAEPQAKGIVRTLTKTWRVSLLKDRQQVAVWAYSAGGERGESSPLMVDCPTPPIVQPGKLYVLAIGVAKYRLKSVNQLDFPFADATEFCKAFRGEVHDFQDKKRPLSPVFFSEKQVRMIADTEATRDTIAAGFHWLKEKTLPQDTVVVYYSGHGFVSESGKFFLIPHEGDPGDVEASCVPDSVLCDGLSSVKAQTRIVLLDACHSGAVRADDMMSRGLNASNDVISTSLTNKLLKAVVMVSSTREQESFEHSEVKHGFFTVALLKGLAGEADALPKDSVVNSNELSTYVEAEVQTLAAKYGKTQEALTARNLSGAVKLMAPADYFKTLLQAAAKPSAE